MDIALKNAIERFRVDVQDFTELVAACWLLRQYESSDWARGVLESVGITVRQFTNGVQSWWGSTLFAEVKFGAGLYEHFRGKNGISNTIFTANVGNDSGTERT